jgi:hypothetical protein
LGGGALLAAAALSLSLLPTPAAGADWSVTPQISAGVTYDNNVNFNYQDKESDIIVNVAPRVDFNYASDITTLMGGLGLRGLTYSRDRSFDRLDQDYRFSGSRKVLPRLSLTLNASYINDSTQIEELTASGLATRRVPRVALTLGPGLSYQITERLQMNLGYQYSSVTYDDPEFNDSFTQGVSWGLRYPLKNEKTTLGASIQGRVSEYPDLDNTFRTLNPAVTIEHRFSEEWSGSLSGGLNFNWYTVNTEVFDFVDSPDFILVRRRTTKSFNVQPMFQVSGARRWTKTTLSLAYRRDQSTSYLGNISEVHSGTVSVTHAFTERLSGSLGSGVNYNVSSPSTGQFRQFNVNIAPQLSYRLTERLSVSARYQYYWVRDLEGDRSTNRQTVGLFLSYAYPLHYQR